MTNNENFHLVNGELIEEKDVKVSINDRGYYFGDGVYEVVKVYNRKMFTGKEHIDRLFESAAKIKMVIPYTKEQVEEMLYALIEKNDLKTGHVYFQVTRGEAKRIHQFPEGVVIPVFTAYTVVGERPFEKQKEGVKVTLVEDERWFKCDIKSLNLLANVLAKQEATEAGSFEAVLHRGETVTEGSASNMYGIKDGVLYTHPVGNRILNGITRRVVLDIADKSGLVITEEAMTVEEFLSMDELFLTSTTSEVMPIVQVDNKIIGDGKVGKWVRTLQKGYDERILEVHDVQKAG